VPLLALSLAVSLGLGALALVLRSGAARSGRLVVALGMLLAGGAFAAMRPHAAPPRASTPKISHAAGYAGSGTCASCHPSEYASWSRTFHRTMTQRASKGTVLAPLEMPIDADGERYTLTADDEGAVWALHGQDPRERLLLTTGSHHMQGYWVAGDAGALRMLPFVFVREDDQVLPRRDAFVQPPDAPQHDVRWNSNCIACHATGGEPRADARSTAYETQVAELGIACEACHGPGAAHVAQHGDPFERAAQRRSGHADPTISNPERLSPERGSAACGQCHSYAYPKDEEAFWRNGYVGAFRPGDTLDRSRVLLSPAVLADPRGPKVDVNVEDLFWADGTVRVAGREYNAMIRSACFARGTGAQQIACTSCHSMHASDPDDMLRRDRSMQAACNSCHTMPEGHSRHAPGSPGDACVACHMPKTSYALRTAIRSHRIDVPDERGEPGPPNACNLCHLDRSLAWTVRTLRGWHREAPGDEGLPDVPESARGLLSRDAAERVLWADAMGDVDALAVSGTDWEGALLDYAAAGDPYAVVRYVAARSRRKLAGAKQAKSRAQVSLTREDVTALVEGRDDRDIVVAE
jgi:predicted CXXCH cytochrome family protein